MGVTVKNMIETISNPGKACGTDFCDTMCYQIFWEEEFYYEYKICNE